MAIDSTINTNNIEKYKSKIEKMFFDLDNQKIKDKPIEKTLKIIHEYVEENFFKRYELVSDLPRFLNYGIFNCVSGTILYAIIFDHYHYEYEIKEVPSHVYIL